MKKLTLIAAASLLATGAFAQSTTTVYGRVNVSVESQTVNNTTETAFQDNRSRIGFKANRKIDGGMSVGATLEAAVNVAKGGVSTGGSLAGGASNNGTGSGELFAREATVNIAGGFGKIVAGKLPASQAYFATADYVSNHNHDTGTSDDALFGHLTTGQFKNALSYEGSTGNLSYTVSYGFRKNGNTDTTTPTGSESPKALTLGYNAGALGLGLAHEVLGTMKATTLRANYTMGNLLVGGYLESDGGTATVGGSSIGRTAMRLSAMYTMGKSELHFNTGRAGSVANTDNTGASQTTLFYNYNIDKSLKAFAGYTTVANQANGTYGMSAIAASANAGTRSSATSVGVRYNF